MPDATPGRAPKALFLAFGIVAVGIVTAGYFYYRGYEKQYRVQVERQLLAVADLKVRDLVEWRTERLADAEVLRSNPVFSALVSRTLTNPRDAEAERLLRTWLSQVRVAYGYDRLILLDARGVARIAVPGTAEPASPHLARDAAEVLRSGQKAFLDFHRESPPGGPIRLAVLVTILRERGGGRPLGVLVLRVDPTTYLYPSIQRRPVPSRTSEILIVRRDRNDVQYLNALRFGPDAALSLRLPLTRTDVPAVQAVLGHEGILDGSDYRGVPVVSAVRSVPGSPWFVVAKTDVSEAYAPLRQRLWAMVLVVGAVVAGAGAAIGWLWRQRSARFYREGYEAQLGRQHAEDALRESERAFRETLRHLDEGYYSVTPDGLVLDHNLAFNRILGFDVALDMRGRHTPDFWLNPEDRQAYLNELMTTGILRNYLANVKTASGEKVVVLINSHLEKDEQGGLVRIVGTFTDFTERKQQEEALARRVDELSQFSAAAVGRELRMVELKEQVNELARQLSQPPPYQMESLNEAVPASAPGGDA